MSNSHFEGFENILTPKIGTGINGIPLKHPWRLFDDYACIIDDHKVVHNAVIFTFWYSRVLPLHRMH